MLIDDLKAYANNAARILKQCKNHERANSVTREFSTLLLGYHTRRTRVRNERSPLIFLPRSVLALIIGFLSRPDSISVSHTCTALLSIVPALPRPPLSRRLPGNPTALTAVIKQGSAVPLKVEFMFGFGNDEQYFALFDAIAEYSPNISRLSLARLYQHTDWQYVAFALSHPMPSLESMRVLWGKHGMTQSLPSELFSGFAPPKLRACTLSGVSIPTDCYYVLRHVTSIEYTVSSMSKRDLFAIVDGLPALENLVLDVAYFFDADVEMHTQRRLRYLRSKVLGYAGPEHLHCILGLAAEHRALQCAIDVEWWWTTIFSILSRVTMLDIGRNVAELRARDRSSGMPVSAVFRPMRSSVERCFEAARWLHKFRHLTTLTIHELHWPEHAHHLHADALDTLNVTLAYCADYNKRARRRANEVGIFLADASEPWRLPALCVLHFAHAPLTQCTYYSEAEPRRRGSGRRTSACCCAPTLSVSLADVERFIATCLGYTRPRLESLSLTGVEPIDVDVGPALARLQDRAEIFRIESLCDRALADTPDSEWTKVFTEVRSTRANLSSIVL